MRRILFVIAILGLLVSGYLAVVYITGGPIVCGEAHGCETVRASQYSSFIGIPTPLFGVIFYLLLAAGAILFTPGNRRRLAWPLALLTAIGLLTSAWLTYLEAFVINAWCFWCVISALLTVAAAVIVWGKLPSLLKHNSFSTHDD